MNINSSNNSMSAFVKNDTQQTDYRIQTQESTTPYIEEELKIKSESLGFNIKNLDSLEEVRIMKFNLINMK
jgi:hypothetical protein